MVNSIAGLAVRAGVDGSLLAARRDRVCILSENRVEYVDAFWRRQIRYHPGPLGTRRATAHELHQILADCGPRCLMYSARYESSRLSSSNSWPSEHFISLDAEDETPKALSYATAIDRFIQIRSHETATRDIFCLLYTTVLRDGRRA